MPRPFCFMIMPFGKKPTQAEAGRGVPEIDFNALWDRAYAPVIDALGYEPVRADQDSGALIIKQMMERLYFADLVLAEMTIPNGNVYYEVGIRHAAREKGCVLLAADWSKQLFDTAQFRMVRYPLTDGLFAQEETAKAIAAAIKDPIQNLATGESPMHGSIAGYPDRVDEAAASTMQKAMAELAAFQGEIRAVRALPLDSRMARAKQLVDIYWKPPVTQLTALTLVKMLRDCADKPDDWTWLSDFVVKLPANIGQPEEVREIAAFAAANGGKTNDAIAQLEALIALSGPTPERLGLLGGRYKRLFTQGAPADRTANLAKSIDAYERGMELDLNQYYCSGNLPRLYRQRKRKTDEMRAQSVAPIVLAACERAKKRGLADEWLNPTLLGAAFDAHDCDRAEELAALVAEEGAARWKIDSTLSDLELSVSQVEDPATKEKLAAILEGLKR